jgi:single-strand DNA-binding protein
MAGSYNHIILVGRLVADPELRQTPDGTQVCSFRMAVDRPKRRNAAEKRTDFFGVTLWRQRAETASKYLQKGKAVLVSGRLQIREYLDRNDTKQKAVEVIADDFQFMDSRSEGNGEASKPQGTTGGSDLPNYEYSDSDEEIPF